MPTYDVQGRIRTLAQLYSDWEFEIRGIHLSQWTFESGAPRGRGWLARAIIKADDVEAAYIRFQHDLTELTDRIAFVSQCYTAVEGESSLILPQENNPDRAFFFNFSFERGSSPLGFGLEQQAALARLEIYEERGNAFRLLREACNSPWFYTRFSMLVAALEALAGEVNTDRGPIRNTEYIRDVILKDEVLNDQIFKFRNGVRNQVLHGRKFEDSGADGGNIVDAIYDAIRRYFREEHDVHLEENVIRPMRNPTENFHGWRHWLKPRSPNTKIELKPIWELAKADHEPQPDGRDERFYDLFTSLPNPPAGL